MTERVVEKKQPEQEESRPNKVNDVLAYGSLSGLLLMFASEISAPKPQAANIQEMSTQQTSLKLPVYYPNISFEYVPYTINSSYFDIQETEADSHLIVSVPAGLKLEVDTNIQAYENTLPIPNTNEEKDEQDRKKKEHRRFLEKNLARAMLSVAQQNGLDYEKSSQIEELLANSKFEIK